MDRASVQVIRLGAFPAWTTALEWLGRRIAERGPCESGGLVYHRLDEIALDAERRVRRTLVVGADDRSRGFIDGDDEKPSGGSPPEECRHKPGDLVGTVSPHVPEYRVGVALAQPATPEAARRAWLTLADNVYLVGTLDADGKPESKDHSHVHPA